MTGCTSTVPANATTVVTPTPQIIYVTVLVTPIPAVTPETMAVTPQTPAVTPEETAPALSEEARMDEAFLEYLDENRILGAMETLSSASSGSYSIHTGYNAVPKGEAVRLTALLLEAPQPGTQQVKALRTAMLGALAMMDGSTAGFTRYRDEMQKVILAKNAAEYEMDLIGSSIVDAKRFYGHGDDVQFYNVTETGLKIFNMHHDGDSNFAITLKDEDGKYIALLVNEIGEYSGKNSERLIKGNYYLTIKADGDWTIVITSG